MTLAAEKQAVRERVWASLEQAGVARFPRPIRGRIPNFLGAETAARSLVARREFQTAGVVKVNPAAPQRLVRAEVLRKGRNCWRRRHGSANCSTDALFDLGSALVYRTRCW